MRTPVLTLEQKAVVCEDVIQLTKATKTLGKLSTIELVKFFNQISMKRFNVQFKKINICTCSSQLGAVDDL